MVMPVILNVIRVFEILYEAYCNVNIYTSRTIYFDSAVINECHVTNDIGMTF